MCSFAAHLRALRFTTRGFAAIEPDIGFPAILRFTTRGFARGCLRGLRWRASQVIARRQNASARSGC